MVRGRAVKSLIALWPVVLCAVVVGCLIGEVNDGASLPSLSGFVQMLTAGLGR
jgi:hypothetical protein